MKGIIYKADILKNPAEFDKAVNKIKIIALEAEKLRTHKNSKLIDLNNIPILHTHTHTCVYKIIVPDTLELCILKSTKKTFTKASQRVHGRNETGGVGSGGTDTRRGR